MVDPTAPLLYSILQEALRKLKLAIETRRNVLEVVMAPLDTGLIVYLSDDETTGLPTTIADLVVDRRSEEMFRSCLDLPIQHINVHTLPSGDVGLAYLGRAMLIEQIAQDWDDFLPMDCTVAVVVNNDKPTIRVTPGQGSKQPSGLPEEMFGVAIVVGSPPMNPGAYINYNREGAS